MKKIMILFGAMLLSVGATMAAMEETETANVEILRSQGYSESTVRVLDTIKALNQGPTGRYKRHFAETKDTPYKAVKLYVDPIQDDGQFGEHEINFTNTWKGNETDYSSNKVEVQDL